VELRLRPLADDELAAYIEASRTGYLSDLVDPVEMAKELA